MSLLLLVEILAAVILILLTSFISYWIYLKNTHYWLDKNVPFQSPFPFLGLFFELFKGKSFYEVDHELYCKHGKIYGAYSGMQPYLFVSDPEIVKVVLVKDFHLFPTRRIFSTDESLINNMVAVATGDQWKNLRHTVTPAFTTGKLKAMIPVISDCAEITTNNFVKLAKEGKVVDCKKLCGNFTLDVIANIAFGTKLDSHNDPNNQFVNHAAKIHDDQFSFERLIAFLFPKIAKLFGKSFFPLETLEFFKQTTNAIIERRKANNEVRPDFLQLMIDSQNAELQPTEELNQVEGTKKNIEKIEQIKRKPLTNEEALAQCVIFFLAGYGGTTVAFTMATYYLAINPRVQDKVLEEVDRIWENRTTLDAEAIYEAKYIEAVIDETLRMCSGVIRIERRVEKDCQLGDTGIPLKEGMIVAIPVYSMHQDPEFFPEPLSFKPERFIKKEDNSNEIKPYTYLPFGAGPRNCVAMRLALLEIKIGLLHLLRSVKFSPCPETKIPMKYFKRSENHMPVEVLLKVTLR